MKEEYLQTDFDLSVLRDKDLELVHILRSIDFVDVQLAIVDLSEEAIQIVQWIPSSIPQCQQYCLDLTKHLAGTCLPPFLCLEEISPTHRPAIIIQPRSQSIWRCCDNQFDSILDYLESRITTDGESRILRMHLLSCLKDTLSFCQADLLKVWNIPADEAAKRTVRLLNICQELKSDGPLLLNILSEEATIPQEGEKDLVEVFHEGVRNEAVARSIADLIANYGGNPNLSLVFSKNLY